MRKIIYTARGKEKASGYCQIMKFKGEGTY